MLCLNEAPSLVFSPFGAKIVDPDCGCSDVRVAARKHCQGALLGRTAVSFQALDEHLARNAYLAYRRNST